MKKIELPRKCKDCRYAIKYNNGDYSCDIRWTLYDEDYKVNPEERDENCPLEKMKEERLDEE